MFTFFKSSVFPAIRVHVWGGFGSQLFALVIAERLQRKSRFRRIEIIFHTSGVTERKLEIPGLWLAKFRTIIVEDFPNQSHEDLIVDKKVYRLKMRQKLKGLLLKLGLTATSNSEMEFSSLKPWVLSIRGHYTEINLKESEILELMQKFELSIETPQLRVIAIHYRLGDLLELEEKGFVSPIRIIKTLKSSMGSNLPIRVFSDSTQYDFKELWQGADGPEIWEFSNLSPIQTVQSCFNAKEFLGTNAKLSLWIALFRSMVSRYPTFVPTEIQHQINTLFKLQTTSNSINVY